MLAASVRTITLRLSGFALGSRSCASIAAEKKASPRFLAAASSPTRLHVPVRRKSNLGNRNAGIFGKQRDQICFPGGGEGRLRQHEVGGCGDGIDALVVGEFDVRLLVAHRADDELQPEQPVMVRDHVAKVGDSVEPGLEHLCHVNAEFFRNGLSVVRIL